MTFREDLARQVIAGTKIITRRKTSTNPRSPWWEGGCTLKPGKSVAVQPGRGKRALGRATILRVTQEPLGHLTDDEARAEGFPDHDAFERAWASINGSYDPATTVWRVVLTATETAP